MNIERKLKTKAFNDSLNKKTIIKRSPYKLGKISRKAIFKRKVLNAFKNKSVFNPLNLPIIDRINYQMYGD